MKKCGEKWEKEEEENKWKGGLSVNSVNLHVSWLGVIFEFNIVRVLERHFMSWIIFIYSLILSRICLIDVVFTFGLPDNEDTVCMQQCIARDNAVAISVPFCQLIEIDGALPCHFPLAILLAARLFLFLMTTLIDFVTSFSFFFRLLCTKPSIFVQKLFNNGELPWWRIKVLKISGFDQ